MVEIRLERIRDVSNELLPLFVVYYPAGDEPLAALAKSLCEVVDTLSRMPISVAEPRAVEVLPITKPRENTDEPHSC